jgi:hypothetical protein
MQCACVLLTSVACPALQYFSTVPHKRHDFREKNVIECEMFVLIFSTTFFWNIFHSKKNWAKYDQKCILVFTPSTRSSFQILMKLEISGQIFEKKKFSRKSIEWEPRCSMRMDGQTDTVKLIVAFRNFRTLLKIKFCEADSAGSTLTRFLVELPKNRVRSLAKIESCCSATCLRQLWGCTP